MPEADNKCRTANSIASNLFTSNLREEATRKMKNKEKRKKYQIQLFHLDFLV